MAEGETLIMIVNKCSKLNLITKSMGKAIR